MDTLSLLSPLCGLPVDSCKPLWQFRYHSTGFRSHPTVQTNSFIPSFRLSFSSFFLYLLCLFLSFSLSFSPCSLFLSFPPSSLFFKFFLYSLFYLYLTISLSCSLFLIFSLFNFLLTFSCFLFFLSFSLLFLFLFCSSLCFSLYLYIF